MIMTPGTILLLLATLAVAIQPALAGRLAAPTSQQAAPVDDARLAKLPPALRDQGRLIVAEPDEDKRADLVELLAEKDAIGALDFLLALLDTDASADVRENIVDELENVADPRVDPALERRVLVDPDV